MSYTIEKIAVWSGSIDDKPGGLAAKLAPLAEAGVNLEFVLAPRDKPGLGVVFLAPIKGATATRVARNAGLSRTRDLAALRITGADKPGLGAAITQALAGARVNLRGLSAIAAGRTSVVYLAFDSKKDTAKAQRALANALR